MKKAKLILSAVAIVGTVGSALAFTNAFGATAVFCKNGNACKYSGFQSATTTGTQTTTPCGASTQYFTTQANNCQSGGITPGTTVFFANTAQ